ncbi:VPLPA-CTERM sorting domain-containing protein [Parvularcula lutaonensis]|uniref:VPLPA-CTERM sorting domain-containing protein n=1 Tax=Parvularcula lutaonensis TaxID=491923 RepID=A0ABV7M9C1_9PROT|nr:VPLPA-CTERM sorting domain-containing protein [Parvularcula lutaonensis]
MRHFLLAAATAATMAIGSANAAIVSFTEGARPLEPGSTKLGDASASPNGTDLDAGLGGSVDRGDIINLFGRIVGSEDVFNFTAGNSFDFNLIPAPSGNSAGVTPERGPSPHQIFFKFTNTDTNIVTTFVANASTPVGTLGTLIAGNYILELDMDPDNRRRVALYDIQVAGVPVPGALPLFVAGLAGFGAMRRRKKA